MKKNCILLWFMFLIFPHNGFSQQQLITNDIYLLPLVFDGKFPVDVSLTLPVDTILNKQTSWGERQEFLSIYNPAEEYIGNLRKQAYRDYVRNHPNRIKYSYSDFPKEAEKIEEIKPNNLFDILFEAEPYFKKPALEKTTRYVPKRKYWILGGSSFLQFSQNKFSDNWYSGGVGNLNLVSVQKFTANYQKGKLQWNNYIEWKLSFYTNPNDSLRNFRLGDDMVRTYSDMGLKAFNDKFFYSSNLEIKTKLMKSYKENTMDYTSAFASPLQINMGILGMKYQLNKTSKKDKYKKVDLSVDVSPLSLQYTWVSDDKVLEQNRYGIEKNETYLLDLGSTMNAKLVWHINRQVSFSSRFKYFSNYEKSIAESENELNISLNRFFSTRFYLYGRFDDTDGIKKDDKLGYIQLNELFSFGFNYKW